MKNTLKVLGIAAMAAFIMVSCGKSASPKETADKFFAALQSKKFDDANKLATDKGVQAVNNLKDFAASDTSMKLEFKVMEPVVTGDSATVKYMANGVEKTALLKKISGEWRVEVAIEDIAAGPEETPMEPVATNNDTLNTSKQEEVSVKK